MTYSLRILLVCAVLSLSTWACSTGQKASNSPNQSGRKVAVTVDAVSKENIKGKTYFFPDEESADNAESIRQLLLVKNALKLAGLTEANAADKADYIMTLGFETKKPVLGISVGALNPYTHSVSLTAKRNDKLVWQIKASGPSEFERQSRFLAMLLGAAEEYIGETTNSPVRVNISTNDSRVEEVINGERQTESDDSTQK
ncbi:MAG: hypothetical protein ACJ763_15800 [Bdellovibrionia bacterium]